LQRFVNGATGQMAETVIGLGFFSTNVRKAAIKNEHSDPRKDKESSVIDLTPVTEEKGRGATATIPAASSRMALVLRRKNERIPPVRPKRNAARYTKRETKTQKTKSLGRPGGKSGPFVGKSVGVLGRSM
jgi:hypothetical protein